MTKLPTLHEHAFKYKNIKRLQKDGGRAWIKDSQLNDARKGARAGVLDRQTGMKGN